MKREDSGRKWHPSIRTKFTISIILMGAALAVCTLTASYIMTRDTNLDKYRQIVASTVQMANTFIDGDRVREYLEEGRAGEDYLSYKDEGSESPLFHGDAQYFRTQAALQHLLNFNNIAYLYVYDPHVDEGLYADYVFDIGVMPAGETVSQDVPEDTGVGYRWKLDPASIDQDTSIPILREILRTGEANLNLNLSVSENGHLASAFMPVFDSTNQIVAIIGADVTVTQVYDDLQSIILTLSFIILGVIALTVFLFSSYVNRNMMRPLQLLVENAYNFVRNHYQNGGVKAEPIIINTRDEMQRLAEAFNTMTEDIAQYISEVTKLNNERERIAAELAVATKIQESALSRDFDIAPDPSMFRLFGIMNPAKEVGGDFYDFFMLPGNEQMCFLVGDVSGKGVPAALFMMMAKSVIRDNMLRGSSLTDSFINANNQLCANNQEGMFVTALCILLNIQTGEMRIIDAGHGQPIRITKGGEITPVKTRRCFVMGGMENIRYRQMDDRLNPGDKLFLFTDGVSEADNEQKELFGMERIYASLAKNRSDRLDDMLAGMREDLRVFAGEAPQADDITMLAFQYKPEECEPHV